MAKIELEAKRREELGKKAKKVRAGGFVPAVVYGRKFSALPVSIVLRDFEKKILMSEAGTNLIFNLKIVENGKTDVVSVITHEIQKNPLTDEIIHLDLMHVVMDEKIKARIPVELSGISTGVKENGGVLVHGLREIEIKCFPGDIPDKFTVDVSALKIGDSLHVSDIGIGERLEVLAPLTEMIATVSAPTKEEEVAPPPAAAEEAAAAAPGTEEAAAAAATAAVAEEKVKEKTPPGGAPPK